MHYYRITLAYKGTHYFGWQAQGAYVLKEEKPTIEGTLLTALKRIIGFKECTVSGASRTDGGVHAQGQVAKLTLPLAIDPARLLQGMNSLLPGDIRVLTCEGSTQAYQPNRASQHKEYHYYFTTGDVEQVAVADMASHYVPSHKPFDPAMMSKACALFVGRHDFTRFSADKNAATRIREIFYCDIHQANFSPLASNVYYLKIVGDGFLKHMIRYVMGALFALDCGRITLHDITQALTITDASAASSDPELSGCHKLSPKAKAKGLTLMAITEKSDLAIPK